MAGGSTYRLFRKTYGDWTNAGSIETSGGSWEQIFDELVREIPARSFKDGEIVVIKNETLSSNGLAVMRVSVPPPSRVSAKIL